VTIFRNEPEINFRAMRDMGLAGWFGSSMMTLVGLVGVNKALDSPAAKHKALDAGMKASTSLTGGCITAYVLGSQFVTAKGSLGILPKFTGWGPPSMFRASLAGTGVAAAITSRMLRQRLSKAYDRKPTTAEGYPEGTKGLRDGITACQTLIPALTAWLLFLHLKQDMVET
jgi:hypothetical protein